MRWQSMAREAYKSEPHTPPFRLTEMNIRPTQKHPARVRSLFLRIVCDQESRQKPSGKATVGYLAADISFVHPSAGLLVRCGRTVPKEGKKKSRPKRRLRPVNIAYAPGCKAPYPKGEPVQSDSRVSVFVVQAKSSPTSGEISAITSSSSW